jgi:hypothetical protein
MFFEVVKNIKTLILCSIAFFFNRVVCEINWKNIVQPDRPQKTTWLICFECLIPEATNTHFEFVIIMTYPRLEWLSERASVSLNTTQPLLHSYKCYLFNGAGFVIGH